jgi:hypothetical protein
VSPAITLPVLHILLRDFFEQGVKPISCTQLHSYASGTLQWSLKYNTGAVDHVSFDANALEMVFEGFAKTPSEY